MDSLKTTDAAAAAVAVAPRVTLADIEAAISSEVFTTGAAIMDNPSDGGFCVASDKPAAALLTLCLLVLRNGFVVVGKSAPASPENFNAELGRKFAKEDAIRQLWPLMGFALRDRLHNGGAA